MKRKLLRLLVLGAGVLGVFDLAARGGVSDWVPVGPNGGDARSFAADPGDPQHVYLGTTTSWIYQSTDGGVSWKRLAKLGKTDDLVVDSLVVDSSNPKTLFAGVWELGQPAGGIYISRDGGITWTTSADIDGQSVLALAQSYSQPKVLVAGTLKGVYRSEDRGQHWAEISPPGSGEIHEVESIAIDPNDPKLIYAGTWHLPWKTADGGEHWHNIKEGLIDDSDVFSIIIDPTRPTVIYTSACSGIYRSENAGELYRKVQGIPSTARRTRVLMQDPINRKIVYAGTTEGLYKTLDDGVNWTRITGPDVIINDIYVNPKDPQHVLLATDRGGVLLSNDSGATFNASNAGFSQRQVAAILVDPKHEGTIYAGVLNDKVYGGVFVSEDGGTTWQQRANGLNGRDVFALALADDGTLLAGTNHGIFRWTGSEWMQDGDLISYTQKTVYAVKKGKKTKSTKQVSKPDGSIDGRVNDINTASGVWFAATSNGIYRSQNQGSSWSGPILTGENYSFVTAKANVVMAANRQQLMLSTDGGTEWHAITLPAKLTSVQAVTTAPKGSLWVGGREGLFYSDDQGQSWQQMATLPMAGINGLSYNNEIGRVVVTSSRSTMVFAIDESSKTWKWWDAGWPLRSVRSLGNRLVAASFYDGVVIQPKQEETAAASSGGGTQP
ncbi:transcriptional regulator [Alloacidobacterium dinghuense]|uniref:Transcriptional regulator n=1 Tax=Alloacidobacterium dinghuense TaxID=2763107 RepID=A0A7G8BKQ2_9BACT|nr:transcriptional regulator [Alloacidobacterium dinghuense]QNI33122.1 transcriptional regulator [Alloacidobacterium dinghuense]